MLRKPLQGSVWDDGGPYKAVAVEVVRTRQLITYFESGADWTSDDVAGVRGSGQSRMAPKFGARAASE